MLEPWGGHLMWYPKLENLWFPEENDLAMVGFPDLWNYRAKYQFGVGMMMDDWTD